MKSVALAAFLAAGLLCSSANATNCSAYPNNLTNGTTADATQVMGNFTSIQTCANSNLAHNGANSDITSLSGMTTPLSVTQGGTGRTSFSMPGGAEFSLASGSTTDLGTATANAVAITGTTTITSFGSSANTSNPYYFIRFTGAMQLTYNATSMVLNTGALNYTTTAGDKAIAQYLGSGNWSVVLFPITPHGGVSIYRSGAQTFTLSHTVGPFTHNLGAIPDFVTVTLTCVTANGGYTAGQTITLNNAPAWAPASVFYGIQVIPSSTSISVVVPATVPVMNPSTFAFTAITAADWTMSIVAGHVQ